MTVGTLVKWLKKEGDPVKTGDVLAEVETDKATMELESFFDGALLAIFVREGSQVAIGEALCAIGKPGEKVAAPAPQGAAGGPGPGGERFRRGPRASPGPGPNAGRGARPRPGPAPGGAGGRPLARGAGTRQDLAPRPEARRREGRRPGRRRRERPRGPHRPGGHRRGIGRRRRSRAPAAGAAASFSKGPLQEDRLVPRLQRQGHDRAAPAGIQDPDPALLPRHRGRRRPDPRAARAAQRGAREGGGQAVRKRLRPQGARPRRCAASRR